MHTWRVHDTQTGLLLYVTFHLQTWEELQWRKLSLLTKTSEARKHLGCLLAVISSILKTEPSQNASVSVNHYRNWYCSASSRHQALIQMTFQLTAHIQLWSFLSKQICSECLVMTHSCCNIYLFFGCHGPPTWTKMFVLQEAKTVQDIYCHLVEILSNLDPKISTLWTSEMSYHHRDSRAELYNLYLLQLVCRLFYNSLLCSLIYRNYE